MEKRVIDKRTIEAYYVSYVMEEYAGVKEEDAMQRALKKMMGRFNLSTEEIDAFMTELKINTVKEAVQIGDFFSIVDEAVKIVAGVDPKTYGEIVEQVKVLVANKFSEIFKEEVQVTDIDVYGSVQGALRKLAKLDRIEVLPNPENIKNNLYIYI